MKPLQFPLFLVLLSPFAAPAVTLQFAGVLDTYNGAVSSAPFTLTVTFDPSLADTVNVTANTVEVYGGDDFAILPTSAYKESVQLDINGTTLYSFTDRVPQRAINFIYNNKDVGPTPGTQFKNEISSDIDITFPDNSRFYFQIDLNSVQPTVTSFIDPNYTQSIALFYSGAYFSFFYSDTNGDTVFQGGGVPDRFSVNAPLPVTATAPAPSTLALLGLGLFGMARRRNCA